MCVTGVYYDYVSLCSRYSILDPYCSRGAIGRAVWGVFADGVILWFYGLGMWLALIGAMGLLHMVVTEVVCVFFVV